MPGPVQVMAGTRPAMTLRLHNMQAINGQEANKAGRCYA